MNLRINNFNNLDDLVINQGYMSERTKSPHRPGGQNQFHQNNCEIYPNLNKLNSNRDMSPNKIMAKNKPLLAGINNREPLTVNNFNHPTAQIQFVESQNRYASNTQDAKAQNMHNFKNNILNKNGAWMNVKSPKSPQLQNHNYGSAISQTNNGSRTCYNHVGKKAEYMTDTEGDIIYYCEACAAKLAAQRFQVIKLPSSNRPTHSNNPHQRNLNRQKVSFKPRQIPNIAKYKGNPIYESIIEFLKEIAQVEQYHFQNYQQLQILDQNYENQIEMVDEFYQQQLDILQNMRRDHISDLNEERKRNSQIKDIFINEIHENLETIEQIVNDLDQNFETVVNKVTQEDKQFFNEVLDKNRSNIRFFVNQIELQRDTLKQFTSYKVQRLSEMIVEFEKCIQEIWQEPKSQKQNFHIQKPSQRHVNNISNQVQAIQLNQPSGSNHSQQYSRGNNNGKNVISQGQQGSNFMNMNQNIPKSGLIRDFQGKGACRQIFQDEDQEAINQQVSPKFKNI